MRRLIVLTFLSVASVLVVFFAGCSGTPTPDVDGGTDAGSNTDAGTASDSGAADAGRGDAGVADGGGSTDAGSADAGVVDGGRANDAGSDAGSPPNLTVKNYLAWCSVSVNGGATSPAAVQAVNVPPGTIPLTHVALAGFKLGLWHHTSGDTDGGGDPGTVTGSGQSASSATTVVVGGTPACVWVCCPFTSGLGCPATDQCP